MFSFYMCLCVVVGCSFVVVACLCVCVSVCASVCVYNAQGPRVSRGPRTKMIPMVPSPWVPCGLVTPVCVCVCVCASARVYVCECVQSHVLLDSS